MRRNEEGKPASLLFVAEDVTEKIQYEQEVAALKELIDDTEDLLHFGSWSWDVSINKLYWTNGMYKLLGYKKEDVESKVTIAFYMKHVAKPGVKAFKKVINEAISQSKHFEHEYYIVTNDKQEKYVSTQGKVVTNSEGEVTRVIGITRDITAQTKTNLDLVHYKEMIMEKEEFLNQGTWETNVQDGTTIWSKGMYRLFGYDVEKDMGTLKITNELHFSHMTEEEIQRSKDDWKKNLKDYDNYSREASIIAKGGAMKQLETYGKILRDGQGNALKVIGTTRDVTKLREYEKGLEEKIQELNRSNVELEEFAYVASHDLQEPLRKLTTFSERLQVKYKKELGKEGIQYLDRIAAATQNMRILIENLLEYSRITRSVKFFRYTDVTKLLEEAKADLELKIEEFQIVINSPQLPHMEVIPSQIKQLFINLLSNSIKFKKPDQQCIIKITCEKLSHYEKNGSNGEPDRPYYKVVIKDNGIGFEREYAEKIFQIFQRLHGKAEYPGSGIGLAICKKIVDNHNGIIYATGHPGEGAAFSFIIPENQS